MKTLSTILIGFITTCAQCSCEHWSALEWSEKADEELASLLLSPDSDCRMRAASSLGIRYQDPREPIIHSKNPYDQVHPIERPVPREIVARLVSLSSTNHSSAERVTALGALAQISVRTNVLTLVRPLIEDTNQFVRIRIVEIAARQAILRGEPMQQRVKDVLRDSLAPKSNPSLLYSAIGIVQQLGTNGVEFAPSLRVLLKHPKSQIRSQAKARHGKCHGKCQFLSFVHLTVSALSEEAQLHAATASHRIFRSYLSRHESG